MPQTEGYVSLLAGFSPAVSFPRADWAEVPDSPGVYVIFDLEEPVYVGMAGRNGKGSLRKRLRDHSTGQVVNMFAQYLYLARAQFQSNERITDPQSAKRVCRSYIDQRCSFRFRILESAAAARAVEDQLRKDLKPAFNGSRRAS